MGICLSSFCKPLVKRHPGEEELFVAMSWLLNSYRRWEMFREPKRDAITVFLQDPLLDTREVNRVSVDHHNGQQVAKPYVQRNRGMVYTQLVARIPIGVGCWCLDGY